jgi:hypothetical protein
VARHELQRRNAVLAVREGFADELREALEARRVQLQADMDCKVHQVQAAADAELVLTLQTLKEQQTAATDAALASVLSRSLFLSLSLSLSLDYIHTHVHIYIDYMHIYTFGNAGTQHTHTHTHTHTHARTHTHTHAHTHTPTHAYT